MGLFGSKRKKSKTELAKSIFRISLLGESDVGKTCTVSNFMGLEFNEQHLTTVGFEKSSKKTSVEDNDQNIDINVVLFDTAGQERFRTVATSTVSCSDGFLVVYSVTDKLTYEKVQYWVEQIREYSSDVPIVICGNKCDLVDQRVVTAEQGQELTKTLGGSITYYDTSAKTGMGIKDAVKDVVQQAYDRYKIEKKNKKKK